MDNFQNDVIAGGGWSLAGKSEYLACVGLMNEVIRHEQMQTNYRRSFVPGFWRDNDTTNEDNNHTHTHARALISEVTEYASCMTIILSCLFYNIGLKIQQGNLI